MPSTIEPSTQNKYFSTRQIHITRQGRPKGSKNISGQSVRWNLLEAYRLNGGLQWLTTWAKDNPDLFMPLLVKLLPAELAESGAGQPIRVLVYAPNGTALTEKPVELAPSVIPQHIDVKS